MDELGIRWRTGGDDGRPGLEPRVEGELDKGHNRGREGRRFGDLGLQVVGAGFLVGLISFELV